MKALLTSLIERWRKSTSTVADEMETQFFYEDLGRLSQVKTPGGHTETYGYGQLGDKTSQTDANGQKTQFYYDSKGRLTGKKLPGGQVTTSAYNSDGTLASTSDYNYVASNG